MKIMQEIGESLLNPQDSVHEDNIKNKNCEH